MIRQYKKLYGLLLSAVFPVILSAETINLKDRLPDSIVVLNGVVTSYPKRTSYGYILTGDGQKIFAFSGDGDLL